MIGGPSWIDSDRFDVEATAGASVPFDELRAMERTLLGDRFHLKTHTETRELPVYVLSLARRDGKLGDHTRQAVKRFWTSARQPAVEVSITDELISDLAERGDGFCKPPRPFFAIGGRAGGNSALPLPFAPGFRTAPVPATAAPPPAPAPAQ